MSSFHLSTAERYSILVGLIEKNNGYLAKALSRNDAFYRYGETSHEYFGNLARDLSDDVKKAGSLTDDILLKYWSKSKSKHTAQGEVVVCRPWMDMIVKANVHRAYYQGTLIFRPHWVQKSVLGVFGGVSNEFIRRT